jgi:hypothetical protein
LTIFGTVLQGLENDQKCALGEQRKNEIMWVKYCVEKASSNAYTKPNSKIEKCVAFSTKYAILVFFIS